MVEKNAWDALTPASALSSRGGIRPVGKTDRFLARQGGAVMALLRCYGAYRGDAFDNPLERRFGHLPEMRAPPVEASLLPSSNLKPNLAARRLVPKRRQRYSPVRL